MNTYLLIIRQLLNNALLFIAFLFIWGQLFKDKKHVLSPTAPKRTRVLCGVTAGVFGGLLMPLLMETRNIFNVDFRYLAIIISATNGGFLSSIITGMIISFFSIRFEGLIHISLFLSSLMFSISLGCGIISKFNIRKSAKWAYMICYAVILQFWVVAITRMSVKDKDQLFIVIIIYSILTVIFGVVVYYLSEYINQSNMLLMKFKEESTTDFLTGLNNVRQFYSFFNDFSKRAVERKESISIIMIDVDWFKSINDTYGHPSGDAVLIQVSDILKRTCRSIDVISRMGGEEFSVLLTNCTNTQAMEIGEHIRKEIENHDFILPSGKKIRISVSAGVAVYPNIVDEIGRLQESADIALYEAKRTGRNRVVLYHGF